MSLQQKIAEYKEQFLAEVPPEKAALMAKATEELEQSGILDGILKEGDLAPDFSLLDPAGNPVSLSGLRGQGNVVLTFYRGVW